MEAPVLPSDIGHHGDLGASPPPLSIPVHDDYMSLPWRSDYRKIFRFESGLILDRHLRRLSRVSGGVDRAVALRLHRIRQGRGYVRLGYARFADWARERTGMSVRTAQELVRLGRGLSRLPSLDLALKDGRVTWTAAVQVARVAGAEDEKNWVRLAESIAVRELTRRVSSFLRGESSCPGEQEKAVNGQSDVACAGETAASGAVDTTGRDDRQTEFDAEADEEQDAPVRMAVEVPRGTALLWEAALDLCDLVSGENIPESDRTECILAELLSALDSAPDGWIPVSPRQPPLAGPGGFGAWFGSGRWGSRTAVLPGPPAPELGSRSLPAGFSRECDEALSLVEDAIPDDPFDLDESVRTLLRARSSLDMDLARLLRNFHSLSLHRHLGFETFCGYVGERLGISSSRATWLVRLDRKLFHYPEIATAVRAGEIGVVAAMLVCRVAAVGVSEKAWVSRAKRCTVRRLKEEVTWVERRADVLGWRVSPYPPPPGRRPSVFEKVASDLERPGKETTEVLADGSDSTLEGVAGSARETFAHPDGEKSLREALVSLAERNDGPRIRVTFSLRASCVDLWNEARQRIAATTGQSCVLDRDILLCAAVECLTTYLPLWFEEVEHGDPVAVRERFRCAVPGCTSRHGSGHHIWFCSQGGPDEPWNLVYLCHAHHIEGVHRGRLRVSGRAPDRLIFELGIRPDGTAHEVFIDGERMIPTTGAIAGSLPDAASRLRAVAMA